MKLNRFAHLDAPDARKTPTKTLMLRGVCTSAGDAYRGDVLDLPRDESRDYASQGRAISEPTDAQIAEVRADVEQREAAGEILRPKP